MTSKIKYRAGGNPPLAHGLFIGNDRIAFLPCDLKPTQDQVDAIHRAFAELGRALSRQDVERVLAGQTPLPYWN